MNVLHKLLIVDDDPIVTKSFDRVLSKKGYTVTVASSGEEALSKLQTEKYDAVFTDIRMSGISGIEVAQNLHVNQPGMPVVIITGFGSEKYETQARKAGVTQFLVKPLTPEMIEESANEAVFSVPKLEVSVETPVSIEQTPEVKNRSRLLDILLFFAAPFIGLAYILAMPFIGLGALVWYASKALKTNKTAKFIAFALVSPVIGLAFVTIGPVIGLAALAYVGLRG